jgi:hypothetical protein
MCEPYKGNDADKILAKFKKDGCIGYKVVQIIDGKPYAPIRANIYRQKVKARRKGQMVHLWINKKTASRNVNMWGPDLIFLKAKLSGAMRVGIAYYNFGTYATTIHGERLEFLEWPFDKKGIYTKKK